MSAILSPFAAEELLASEKPITLPPSSSIAASKLSLVLVEVEYHPLTLQEEDIPHLLLLRLCMNLMMTIP